MLTEIIIGIASGIVLVMFGIIMRELHDVKKRQERAAEYRNCKMDAMDYAMEQKFDGDYIMLRDKKFKQLLDGCNFKRKTA